MKHSLSFSILLFLVLSLSAQQPVKVDTYHLDNGLKVILCENHDQPKIYGCVFVHAGSKNEKPTATGVAHYFEHIMFKGTDRIGTTNWPVESRYLDSISLAYDRLQATSDARERHDIQLEINRLNIEASKYAIPNEVDAILQKMGCTGLNAGTSYDYTVYYNTLPSNQLSNWMDVYVERFRNPVFRLFQSELEAVYEEKNMYENQPIYDFSRNIFTQAFGNHPYSRDVIGLADHLKNPQPSEMQEFFNTYYVANNMTLLLVGDFNTAEAKRLIAAKFSAWRSGQLPEPPAYDMPAFDQPKIVNVKQTPLKAGIMLFPGVTSRHPDYQPLELLGSILGGGSGLLDQATQQGRLMAAELSPIALQDAGRNIVIYLPKILGQSHEEAEKIIWDCIDSIKQGNFSDELIEAIKTRSIVSQQRQLEDYQSIAQLLLNLEAEGSDFAQWQRDNQRWMSLTRDEVIEVANKYFNRDRCTIVRSKMGFPKHDSAVKPDWEHLEAQNTNAHSPFALAIDANKPDPVVPQVVDFKNDVNILPIGGHSRLFSAPNPKNDIFQLSIAYRYGLIDNPDLDRALEYMQSIGCDSLDLTQFNLQLDRLGGSILLVPADDQCLLTLSGLEANLEPIMALCQRWLANPRHDPKQIDIIADNLRADQKAAKNSSGEWFDALTDYVVYGQQSPYLRGSRIKEWKRHTCEQLHHETRQIFTRNSQAYFTGNTDPSTLAELLTRYGLIHDGDSIVDQAPRAFQRSYPQESHIYYCSNKRFLQSDMRFLLPAATFDTADLPASILFTEYFGGGMNSVVFQEIREFRSLGYSTSGRFIYDFFRRNAPYTSCYLGTQCDKTAEGIQAMRDLLVQFPYRPDKFAPAIDHQIVSRNSSYIGFRDLPRFVATALERGETRDMRSETTHRISQLTLDDLQAFHHKYLEGRPLIILISGNAQKFGTKASALGTLLSPTTPVTEIKYKEMRNSE